MLGLNANILCHAPTILLKISVHAVWLTHPIFPISAKATRAARSDLITCNTFTKLITIHLIADRNNVTEELMTRNERSIYPCRLFLIR